jgi:hypothetical protein
MENIMALPSKSLHPKSEAKLPAKTPLFEAV